MKKINTAIIAAVAASLILVAGCYEGGVTQPTPIGYDGFIEDGWDFFNDGDYESAMNSFQQAIDMDATRPEGYLGAGWCSILLPDYWVIGDQYDYMAVQQDGGDWPVAFYAESQTQDIPWETFQCIDPVLTATDQMVLESFGDTILVVEGDTLFWGGETGPDSIKGTVDNLEIGEWLYDQYGSMAFRYTFEIDDPDVKAIFRVANGFSLVDALVDSVVNGSQSTTVYITMPYVRVPIGSEDYRTWIMYENVMSYEYSTYSAAMGSTSIANDGVAAYGILQNARGVNGDFYKGVAALIGLADEAEYSFSHWTGLSSVKLKGMAAAMTYANTEFRFALFICRSEGYAMGIELEDPDFLIELMQEIELMLQ